MAVVLAACSNSPPPPPGATSDPLSVKSVSAASVSAESGPIGTAHPTVLIAADPEGRWVAFCQARQDSDHDGKISVDIGYHGESYGDELTPYLAFGAGAGRAIDDFVGFDRSGRYLAVIENERLLLIDAVTGGRLDLSARGADWAADASPLGPHRAASFGESGDKLVYFRKHRYSYRAVVRTLATGAESVVDPGVGLLWRAEISDDGDWLSAWVVSRDSDRSGKLELPTAQSTLAARRCRGPVSSSSFGGWGGDRPERRMARASGGLAKPAGDVEGSYGDALIKRTPAGLVLVRGEETSPLAPSVCDATLLYADPIRQRILIGCEGGGQADGYALLWTPKLTHRLALGVRELLATGERWLTVSGSRRDAFIDLERARAHELGEHEWVRASEGPRAIGVRRQGSNRHEIIWVDLERGRRTILAKAARVHEYADATLGPMVAIAGRVFDAESGTTRGRYDARPLAIDRHGRLLTAASGVLPGAIPQGPLRWRMPRR